jgi:hypothetical protein
MVKLLVRLSLIISIVSCGAARRPAGGLGIPREPGELGDGIVQGGGEDPDLERRDFEIAEYFEETPAPGGGRSLRATCRLTEGAIGVGDKERSDGYVVLDGGRWKTLCRARRTDGRKSAVSYYASASTESESWRLHGGSFVPGFALGLVFGGSGGPSLSSGAFPFGAPRRIAGTTSYFLKSLYGVAAEIRRGNAYAAAFHGCPVEYGADGPEKGERTVSGARFEARLGGLDAGLSCSTGTSDGAGCVVAIDGRWISDRMKAGFEMGTGGSEAPSLLSGLSCRVGGTRAALLLYAVSPEAAGFFGTVNGRAPGKISSLDGAAAVAERDLFRRVRARVSIDRYGRRDGSHETERVTTRFECERRGRKILVRLAWAGVSSARRDVVPYPPAGEGAPETSSTVGLFPELRIGRGAGIGAALKRVEEPDGLGWLLAPVVRARLFSDRLRATASFAAYRTRRGHPVCYVYQPSLRGTFPVRSVSRSTDMATLVIDIFINKLRVSCHVSNEDWEMPEISLQASAGL